MILQVNEDTNKIAVRVKSWRNQRYVRDWQHVYLVIMPGQHDHCCCNDGGSPWYVHGCWPGHRTDVDLMNPPRPDFPAFHIKAEALDNDMIVWELPMRWRQTVPFGRYAGMIEYMPELTTPFNTVVNLGVWHVPACECLPNPPQQPAMLPPVRPCIISEFDIDYGPRCSQHIIDRIDVELEDDVQ